MCNSRPATSTGSCGGATSILPGTRTAQANAFHHHAFLHMLLYRVQLFRYIVQCPGTLKVVSQHPEMHLAYLRCCALFCCLQVFATQHLPALLARLKPSQPDDVRAAAAGCIAEVAEALQTHMAAHAERVVPVLLRELRCDDPVNRQNAAFALGVMVSGCGPVAMGPYFPSLLQVCAWERGLACVPL